MNSLIDDRQRFEITTIISSDLMFRQAVNDLFQILNASKSSKIEIDFENVLSITRSFAHQYIIAKKQSEKIIHETNVPQNIQRMFELVRKQTKNKRSISLVKNP